MEAEGPYGREGAAQRAGGPRRTWGIGGLRGHRRRRDAAARAGGSPAGAGGQRAADRPGQLSPPRGCAGFRDQAEQAHQPRVALLLFDVDGLKLINDRHGHMVGSQALCRLADVLSSCCRDIDTSARFGGDELALVLPETGAMAANGVARRICESLANDEKGPKLSVSVGVAVYPGNGETIERLLCEADSELYARKPQRIP